MYKYIGEIDSIKAPPTIITATTMYFQSNSCSHCGTVNSSDDP